jgi:hypothetical protein
VVQSYGAQHIMGATVLERKGGRAASEQEKGWAPDISAVRVTVKYAIATGRLEWTPTEEQNRLVQSTPPFLTSHSLYKPKHPVHTVVRLWPLD